jgi:ATP-binding cassette subfamily B protein
MDILLRITDMAWHYRWRTILAYLGFVFAIAFSMVVPLLFGEAIDTAVSAVDQEVVETGEPSIDEEIDARNPFRSLVSSGVDKVAGVFDEDSSTTTILWMLAGGLLIVNVLRGLSDFARTYTTDSLSQKVAYDIRNQMYDKLQHLSFGFHDKEHTGNLMSKVTSDIEAVRRFIMMGLIRSFEVVVRVVLITVILAYTSWELTLISLVFVPFLVARSTMVMTKLRVMWLEVQQIMGQLTTILQENLTGIHVVKAFAAEEHEKKKFAVKAHELRQNYYRNERMQGTNSAWMTLFFTLALGLILWYGGRQVIQGDLTPGDLAIFILFMNQLTFPVRMSAFVIATFSRAISSGRRLFDVIDAQSPVEERAGARAMGDSEGYVQFRDVSFAYDSDVPALKHIDISVPPKSVVALIGAPGSGKSTIVNLLPRFYDVTDGQITVDGEDIREFTLSSLRRNVGIVQQDVYLFNATIRDNIAYGSKDANFDDVVQAAKVAQLHDHIIGLPAGYDTVVGERGVTLSGGQRQRLSIARTVLIDPPVLVLDDSTSSVDVETERLIHRAMIEVMKGRTTFVIAHRLSTVREADLILVMKDGEIIEQGTHQELSTNGGIYQEIYELQLRPQEEVLLDATLAASDGGDS